MDVGTGTDSGRDVLWPTAVRPNGQRGGVCLVPVPIRAVALGHPSAANRTGVSVAEWTRREIYRHSEEGAAAGPADKRQGLQPQADQHSTVVQPRPAPRSLAGPDPGGSLGRDRYLRPTTSDRNGYTQRGNAEGVRLTTEGDKRNSTPTTLSVRIRDRSAQVEVKH
jgi:hypothetical protein